MSDAFRRFISSKAEMKNSLPEEHHKDFEQLADDINAMPDADEFMDWLCGVWSFDDYSDEFVDDDEDA